MQILGGRHRLGEGADDVKEMWRKSDGVMQKQLLQGLKVGIPCKGCCSLCEAAIPERPEGRRVKHSAHRKKALLLSMLSSFSLHWREAGCTYNMLRSEVL